MKKLLYVIIVFIITAGGGLFGQSSPLLGDVNGSGGIDIVDALLTAQYYVGIEPPGFQNSAADVNADGSINIVDALLIAQYYVGLISEFPGQGGGMDVEVIMSGASRDTNPSLQTGELEELVEGNTAFALDFYHTIAGDDDNIIFSPYSISVAFAMCYAGAKGSTDSEIADVLHFTLGQSALHNAFNALDIELAKPGTYIPSGSTGDQFILKITNSIWGQRGYLFVQNFLDTLAVNYGAGLNVLDFLANPESCRITINDWVSDHTEQKINDLLPPGSINDLTRLVLTNAIYFKGSWAGKFDPENTVPATFTLLDGTTTTVQMMKKSLQASANEVTGEYSIAAIPYYGGKASMIIILPAQGRFKAVESSLTPEILSTMIDSISTKTLTLSMPKFNFDWGNSIKEVLSDLGMKLSFSGNADFTGITTAERLMIGDVIHKATISVDEQGTEAAAATAITMPPSAPPPLTMSLSRPFIFFIRESVTGTILFAGRLIDP
jgi:serpin B